MVPRFELKELGLVGGIIVPFVGILGAFASFGQYGLVGIIVPFVLALVLLVVYYWRLHPVLVKNQRGLTLLQSIRDVGLTDIENRDDTQHPLPPHQFYESASREIIITGPTLYRTFEQHISEIRKALNQGIKIYTLMLHPTSPEVEELSQVENISIRGQIEGSIAIVEKEKLHGHPGFQIRFMQKLPPFRGVMIDGDIYPTGKTPHDQGGRIRVQPHTQYITGHQGVILQLRKTSGQVAGVFDYFAADLRNQWRAAEEDSGLFASANKAN